MKSVYILGVYSTKIQRWPEKGHRDLVREAYLGVLEDAQLESGEVIDSVWSGNNQMHYFGQKAIRGQVTMLPLIEEGLLPSRVSMCNVEGGCATGSLALQCAWRDILSGQSQVALAIGFDKLFIPNDPVATYGQFKEGYDCLTPDWWHKSYEDVAKMIGSSIEFDAPGRSVAMDTYGMQAKYHMWKHGSTQHQLAIIGAKNHCNGALNPKAQYQFKMTPEDVLQDREVSWPLTRSMCAPIGDGAAAAILCSEEFYNNLPEKVKVRAVKIAGCGLTSGRLRKPEEPSLSYYAAKRAYEVAGIKPEDIDLAEVHDATAFSEIYQAEMMGFCPVGEGGKLAEAGETQIGGRIPINTSGGLISKGHPIGATGLSMTYELVTQLRGEADQRQVKDPEFALLENGGGVIGLEEACCNVIIFQRI